jgi:membrane-associated phospholipid phosphatase
MIGSVYQMQRQTCRGAPTVIGVSFMKRILSDIGAVSIVFIAITIICYYFVDPYVANFVSSIEMIHTHEFKKIVDFFSMLGLQLAFSGYFVIFFLWIFYRYDHKKQISYDLIYVLMVVFSTNCVIMIMTPMFSRATPQLFMEMSVYGMQFLFAYDSMSNSFPSGHVGRMAALVAALWVVFPKQKFWILGILGTIGFLVGLSKIFAARHFLSDEIFSIYIAIFFTYYFNRAFYRFHAKGTQLKNT